MRLEQIGDKKLTDKELLRMAHEIVEHGKSDPDGFIEKELGGATVVQLGPLHIAVAVPPFSDGVEITAVRPIAKLSLEEYAFSKVLKDRIIEKRRGILVAGPPGAGKSTFAQAIAEFLYGHDFIVKTMESPRDLQLPEAITQYAPPDGHGKTPPTSFCWSGRTTRSTTSSARRRISWCSRTCAWPASA